MPRLFIIAGEASGDNIGAEIIKQLAEKFEIAGIGGAKMEAVGLKSIFPIEQISLMGFAEILPHLPKLLKLINITIREIKKFQPDIVVTIDSPGFTTRVIGKFAKSARKFKAIHIVAPTVWAYKPKRAKKFARIFDHLLAILPFEPIFFKKEGLRCSFIGHPIFDILPEIDKSQARIELIKKYQLDPDKKILCVMPGSRNSEIEKMLPIFIDAAMKLDEFQVMMPILPHLMEKVKLLAASNSIITISPEDKYRLMAAADAGIIKSGTSAIEAAIYQMPMVIAYKVHPFSAWIIKKMIKTKFVNLVNIIENKEIIRELLQENCNSEQIVKSIRDLANRPDYSSIINKMRREKPATQIAAELILEEAFAQVS